MMNPSIEEVTRWLQSKSNHTLHISKQEEKDQDQIKIQLERFEHQRIKSSPSTVMETAMRSCRTAPALSSRPAMKRRAPSDAFVIGLDGLTVADIQDHQVVLTTDRSIYSITTT